MSIKFITYQGRSLARLTGGAVQSGWLVKGVRAVSAAWTPLKFYQIIF